MNKIVLNKPLLLCFYGFPGSGKSYIGRNLETSIQFARVSADRIRHELFSSPRYDSQENAIVNHLMNYVTEEFLRAGVSVIYDTNAQRIAQRRFLSNLAKKHHAEYLLVWIQIDAENSFIRTQKRDRRTLDDKYSQEQTMQSFENQMSQMQNPIDEDYLVVSGKHAFATQKSAIVSRLYQKGLIPTGAVQSSLTKPGLVNLVPNPHAGRVDMTRRNITVS